MTTYKGEDMIGDDGFGNKVKEKALAVVTEQWEKSVERYRKELHAIEEENARRVSEWETKVARVTAFRDAVAAAIR